MAPSRAGIGRRRDTRRPSKPTVRPALPLPAGATKRAVQDAPGNHYLPAGPGAAALHARALKPSVSGARS